MIALREYVKVEDHQLHIQLPNDFNYDEVEVLIIPKSPAGDQNDSDEVSSIQSVGKIGMHSKSFVDDDEDYSQW